MLKKTAIAAGATVIAMLGVGGVAYADSNHAGTKCSATEKTTQKNKHKQLVGGNVIAKNIDGFIGGSVTNSVFCPSAFNGSSAGSSDDSDD